MQNINNIFESATLKLNLWFISAVMLISIGFSFVIYQTSIDEFKSRFDAIETRLEKNEQFQINPGIIDDIRADQSAKTRTKLATMLFNVNLLLMVVSAIAGHLWARRTLEPIEKLHKSQSKFTSDVSHEFKTPLAVMKAEIEYALCDSSTTKAELKEILESNLEEVERLSNLSTILLKMSNLEVEKIQKSSLNLESTAKDAIKTFSKTDQKRIKIINKNTKCNICGNYETIRELLTILIDNAIKYSKPKTEIDILIHKNINHPMIEVVNIGESIPKDEIEKIFNRFYKVDKSRNKTNEDSYGLGLSLAKKIIDIHNGEISAKQKDEKISFIIKF